MTDAAAGTKDPSLRRITRIIKIQIRKEEVCPMDFDREYELEEAGIDAFDFSLMDDDEKAEALRDAGLDPDDYEDLAFDSSFDAWAALQDNGLSLWELDLMDEEEKREALEDAGLDPDDYDTSPIRVSPAYFSPPAPPAEPQKSVHRETPKAEQAPPKPPEVYRYCEVNFPGTPKSYTYLADKCKVSKGEFVLVPTGPDNSPKVARVVSVGEYPEENALHPVEGTKHVLRKASFAEIASAVPRDQTVETPIINDPEVKQTPAQTDAPSPETEDPKTKELPNRPESSEPTPQKRIHVGWFIALAAILYVTIAIGLNSSPTQERSSSGTYRSSYSYSGGYSSTPTKPPVNRERAMTKEGAERRRGTGYHGTRPNSSAEEIELKAAQVRCKNCGYHSDNGVNSLCDYCAWMERNGGGLPTQKALDATPEPTPRPTTKPTAKPESSDPYHASDYSHPEDFYYDYYDDFWDYEDAEDYWEEHHGS
jgi:hypothetical protein